MSTEQKTVITVQSTVNAPVQKVWDYWTKPEHIVNWCFASPDWHAPKAENDLREGGEFTNRMEAKDGSMGFDFSGKYDVVTPNKHIAYSTIDNERKVSIDFSEENGATTISESFDAEETNPIEMQRMGWQAILDNFKAYVESN